MPAAWGPSLGAGLEGVPAVGIDADESGASMLVWTRDGDVLGLGHSEIGLFGDGSGSSPVPVTALEASVVHEVSVGADTACAMTGASRELSCWGRNDLGQLGRGDTSAPGDRAEDLRAAAPRW